MDAWAEYAAQFHAPLLVAREQSVDAAGVDASSQLMRLVDAAGGQASSVAGSGSVNFYRLLTQSIQSELAGEPGHVCFWC